jgi:Mrp family chromosome partitioning ATPase
MPPASLGVVVAHDDRDVIEQIAGVLEAIPDLFVAATSLDAARAGHVVVAGGEVLFNARNVVQPLVAVACGDPVRAARAALAAGARELIRWPDESDRLAGAVRRAASNGHSVAGEGIVIAVAGARGGVGTSTMVACLAAALGEAIVVDLDPVGRGQRAFAPPGDPRTIDDVLTSLADIDPDALAANLVSHAADARALHASPTGAQLDVREMNGLLRAVRGCARFTVIDCGRAHSSDSTFAARNADIRIVVAADDVASIRGSRWLLADAFHGAQVVLRRERHRGISMRDLESAFGRRPDAVVGTSRSIARLVDLGRVPKRAPKSLARLAGKLKVEHGG